MTSAISWQNGILLNKGELMCALEWLGGPMYGLCLIRQLPDALQGIFRGRILLFSFLFGVWLAYMTRASIEKGLPLNFEHEISPIFFFFISQTLSHLANLNFIYIQMYLLGRLTGSGRSF